MARRRGVVLKNFLILISFITMLIILITFLIYQNAVSVLKEELCAVNMNRASQIADNMNRVIGQTNRLASSICTRDEAGLFWGLEYPEKADEYFYSRLSSNLKTYSYSLGDYISSIILYAPVYNRIMDSDMKSPYEMKGSEKDAEKNIDWIQRLEELGVERVKTTFQVRAVRNSYPYVLTLVKQYGTGMNWGAVAVDIDLENVYSVIWPREDEDILIWVLDEEGRVIVREKKNELYASLDSFEELKLFDKTQKEVSVLNEDGNIAFTYAQRYLADYEFYVVTVSRLEDFKMQMSKHRWNAIGIGFCCVVLACFLVWIYVSFANQPIKSILNLLQNPMNYDDYMNQTEHEVKEIVDRIVSNLQMNDTLRKELDKRVELLHQTQLQALKAQINPHFLFNTLNVIVMLLDEVEEESCAAQVTAYLADVLHYSLSDDELVSISDEMEHTRKYVFILEQRYRGNFLAKFDMAPELMKVKVPKLILQPLIENAVFHGIVAKEECAGGLLEVMGRTELCSFEQEKMWTVRIDIKDNGQGMTEEDIVKIKKSLQDEHISMKHIGVRNVAKRLTLLFPQRSKIEIQSKIGVGTCVTMWFPFIPIRNDE